MKRYTPFRLPALLLATLVLASCAGGDGLLAPADPDDPRGAGHAVWCGTNPPSGYCIVPEAR